ncbi:copper transport protein ATX1-like isoform X1 [Iris pallida]|uniref:Copper transport protein ATX1-like isoform X1 n=1 Tax=Iris pallida TaxID=29817 RepID=A0AAX6ILZ5_IRIPA|nr:copper transport protein ATX1-like isoform X1 [Iris pallida]KAJ6853804.1 copper transport protein ATX1-like isoform X1 [Iris pallida]
MAETVVLKVAMSCQGCVGAVNRVLTKMEGVETFDIDIKEQKVIVKGNVKPDAVLQTVSKTGKKTSFWEAEPETKEASAPTAAATEASAPTAATPEASAPTAASTEGSAPADTAAATIA